MEASTAMPQTKPFPQLPRTTFPPAVLSLPHSPARLIRKQNLSMRCSKQGGVSASEGEKKLMESEFKMEEDLMEMKKLSDKCGDSGAEGLAEVMECLEREAIMGEDEGRHPMDYDRRAKIFHTSSRVFQALKQASAG